MARLFLCPDCGNQVSRSAPACPKCGRVMQKASRPIGCCGGIVVISLAGLVLFVILAITSAPHPPGPDGSHQDSNPSNASRSDPVTKPSLNVGDTVLVGRPGERLTLAVDNASWDEMIVLQNAKDTEGLARLVLRGKIFVVDGGTRARLIDVSFTANRVRVLDGPAAGADGWVQYEFVHPER